MSELTIKADDDYGLASIGAMSPALAILFNDKLYQRCKEIATLMSKAEGFTPGHLIGKGEACFSVVQMSIAWRMNPQAVALSTYSTPGGKIGYEGKLVQAILENSGYFVGPITYELYGEWDRVRGKFEYKKNDKGKTYPVPKWTVADEEGLGVKVRGQVRGEATMREADLLLSECYPRNSTLWALRPSQQIKYAAARIFGNVAAPGILLGVPFDNDFDSGERMRDVTPARSAMIDPNAEDLDDRDMMPATAEEPAKASSEPAKASSSIDPETGELIEEQEPLPGEVDQPEFSAADAYAAGAKAFSDGSARSAPAAYTEAHKGAWLEGYDEAQREAATAPRKRAPSKRPM